MEEVMSMIFQGFKLVMELESSLPEKSLEALSTSLDEITKTFGDANERLKIVLRNSDTALDQLKPVVVSCSDQLLMQNEPGLMQEYWLRCGGSTSSQGIGAVTQIRQIMAVEDGGRNLTAAERSGGSGSNPSTPRQRRRKNEGEEHVVLVAALRTGNINLPPDDNHTWRKYGQKEILGSKFPRAYYRCTHQKLYNCPAKKQVQRLNEDPFTFRVTYRGSHTCHIYSTAPTASATAPTAPVTTSLSLDYGPSFFDMADAMMFDSSGIGANMDIFSFSDLSHHDDHCYRRSEDGDDGDK
ncbi:WRKY transcription factor 55 [Raphanus sativus]|uniref:WRKY transcription factor 55-like n=1 Tax=Raphanus sativus TaxID=3726 RepID=A0A6J0NBT5_RAPSA|nr:WRKY transcription factor 55-like [Raphanus sativus]KAJ4904000.1 WRKY transcription factor 55 [Raphanus sativus]